MKFATKEQAVAVIFYALGQLDARVKNNSGGIVHTSVLINEIQPAMRWLSVFLLKNVQ